MGRALVLLCLLLQGLAVTLGAGVAPNHAHHDHDTTPQTDVAAGRDADQSTAREPGADLVDDALKHLRLLPSPQHLRRQKRSGSLGLVSGLLNFVLPSLRLNAPPQPMMSTRSTSGPLHDAIGLLEESAQKNNSDALYMLAEMNFYGNYSLPHDFVAARDYYQRLAALNGNSSAMYMLGMMYSTGVGGAVQRDQAKALVYYTFAALRGHTRAEMTVAARHASAIGTPKNCEEAVKYYKRVADKAIAYYRSGPPGGTTWTTEAYSIADAYGGFYGEGASVSSAGAAASSARGNPDRYASIEDVIEYLDVLVHKGDFRAAFNLGQLYYDGRRKLDRNPHLARKYFRKIASKYWGTRGTPIDNPPPGLDRVAGKAAGFLGRMYLRGEGITQNFDRAIDWFRRGVSLGDAQSHFGMGLMLMKGHGIPRNLAKATDYFKAAAAHDHAAAQVQLGALYLDEGGPDHIRAAIEAFEAAARPGNIEAHFYLGEMISHGVGMERSCTRALSFYRSVAEKAEPLVSSWTEANLAYDDGDIEAAFLQYVGAAEQGYERAQSNVAYLLDEHKSLLPLPEHLSRRITISPELHDASLGLIYFTRSSRHGNIDSLVKMGDYYLEGIGTEPSVDKAVQCYQGAADYYQSAQALYNLGWMHEYGIGLDQDYHLAKRYYDEALFVNDEAYLPVTLALMKLRAKSAWNTLTNGGIKSIQDDPGPIPGKEWSFGEWVANFLQDDYYMDDYNMQDDGFDHTMPGGDAAMPADLEDGLTETLIILGLAAMLAFLVYYRQHRQQAHREENERGRGAGGAPAAGQAAGAAAPPLGEDRGMFPRPDDPEFQRWVAGGVGH